MNSQNDSLPTVAAMDAALEAAALWDKGFGNAVVRMNGKVFICKEVKSSKTIFVNEVCVNRDIFGSYGTVKGKTSIYSLAEMLDTLSTSPTKAELMVHVDEAISEIKPHFINRTVEQVADKVFSLRNTGSMFRWGFGSEFLVACALTLYGFDAEESAKIAIKKGNSLVDCYDVDTIKPRLCKLVYAEIARKNRECAGV